MEPYINSSGKSGVHQFEIKDDAIDVVFVKDDFVYTYNAIKPGKEKVGIMKKLAREGRKLSTFISQNVRGNYYSKRKLKKLGRKGIKL